MRKLNLSIYLIGVFLIIIPLVFPSVKIKLFYSKSFSISSLGIILLGIALLSEYHLSNDVVKFFSYRSQNIVAYFLILFGFTDFLSMPLRSVIDVILACLLTIILLYKNKKMNKDITDFLK